MMTMYWIRRMHKVWDCETKKWMRNPVKYGPHHPLALYQRDLDTTNFAAMAIKWRVSRLEMRDFVRLQKFVHAFATGATEVTIYQQAKLFKVPAEEMIEFDNYVTGRVEQIMADLADTEAHDFISGAELEQTHDRKVRRARILSILDLQEDGGRRGLAN